MSILNKFKFKNGNKKLLLVLSIYVLFSFYHDFQSSLVFINEFTPYLFYSIVLFINIIYSVIMYGILEFNVPLDTV